MPTALHRNISGVGTGGSGGSMNQGPRAPGAPREWDHRKKLSKTLRKIIKIVATRWRILRLKCTKLDFGWDCARDPAGELTALLRPRSWIWVRFAVGAGLEKRRERGGRGSGGKGRAPSYCWTRAPQSLATPLRNTIISSVA